MSQSRDIARSAEPVHRSVRRLRWFVRSFHEQAARTSGETGVEYAVDDRRLAEVFVTWLRDFERQKPRDDADRLPYVGFAAGLMLKRLIRCKPARAIRIPPGSDASNPAYFWPEGYLYVAYCLNVRGLVLEQDFHESQAAVPELSEPRVWWTFKENVDRDPELAVGFLDLFAGEEPHWSMPGLFQPGRTRRIAARYFREVGTDDTSGEG